MDFPAVRLGLIIVNHASFADALVAINSVRAAFDDALAKIVVVENGTGEAERFLERGLDVIDFPENRGFAFGVNAGAACLLDECPGLEAFLLLNPDAFLEPGPWLSWLGSMTMDVAAKGPAIVAPDGEVLASAYEDIDPRRVPLEALGLHRWLNALGVRRRLPELRTEVATLQGSCLLVNCAAWMTIGPFDPGFFLYHEETDWCLRARDRGLQVIYDPAVSALHEKGVTVPPGREPVYFRGAVRLVEKRFGAAAAIEVRRQIRQAARWGSWLTRDTERRRGLALVAEEL